LYIEQFIVVRNESKHTNSAALVRSIGDVTKAVMAAMSDSPNGDISHNKRPPREQNLHTPKTRAHRPSGLATNLHSHSYVATQYFEWRSISHGRLPRLHLYLSALIAV